MSPVDIDVWSDYVCPFCYLAEPPLARVEHERAGTVHVRWRAFELRPEPVPTLDPNGDYLRDIWARAVYPMARERGLSLRLPPVQPRSRLAHEAAAFARAQARASVMQNALFRAFFEQGEDIGRIDVLLAIGAQQGLDRTQLEEALTRGTHRQEVLDDEHLAAELGLSGVPAIVVRSQGAAWNQAVLIEGAQPYEAINEVVSRFAGAPEPHQAETRAAEP